MSQWPVYDDEQISAVTALLQSGKVNAWTGPDVRAFEEEYKAYTGAGYAVALANGTATLDVAFRTLGLSEGDEVIVTPRSFIASASSIMLAGAVPVFAEIDRDSGNITAQTIAPLITGKTKGILAVHLGGWPCDMDEINALADAKGLWVIEDCAQAHGAMIGDRPVGTMSTFGSYSFCQDKIISTGGEGGMLITDDEALWAEAWSFKDHGKGYKTVFEKDHPPGFRWLHDNGPGTNLRMTGLSAAIGRIQLKRLDDWRSHRAANAQVLTEVLSRAPALRVPRVPQGMTHAFYRFYAYVRPEALAAGWSRDRIIAEVGTAGFPIFSGSCSEMYLEETFTKHGVGPKDRLPVAKELGETSLCFLTDPTWDTDRIAKLAECTYDVVMRATA